LIFNILLTANCLLKTAYLLIFNRMNRVSLLLLVTITLGAGCTTQKQRGELKGIKKLYHNTTAKYNGYFNANEIMEKTYVQLDEQHRDNYTKLLEVYPYVAANNPQAVAPQLDTAIKKVSVVVNLHRKSDWSDDCYLLVGQAQFLKKDYESAESTFRFISNEFNPYEPKKARRVASSKSLADKREAAQEVNKEREITAKQKKKDQERARNERLKRAKQLKKEREKYNAAVKKARKQGKPAPKRPSFMSSRSDTLAKPALTLPPIKAEETKESLAKKEADKKKEEEEKKKDPENYFLKRPPAYQEGLLWLAKTYIERDKLESSQRLITQMLNDTRTFEDIRNELPALQAYLNLKLKKYDFVVQNLEQAIDVADTRAEKARYSYILAQLYQRNGNSDAAYKTFDQVAKYTNDYEMEFSARLSMAQNGNGIQGEAIANLEKMLKDDKNNEYRDQIYFAMANIALKAGDRAKAIETFQLSLQQPSQNTAQRADTYVTLAQLFYEDENYIPAKNYYDSTLLVLEKTDERYAEVDRLSKSLTDIAKNLGVIVLQDSLLRIGNMSEAEQKAFAADLKEQQEAALAAKTAQAAAPTANKNAPTSARSVSSPGPALQKESSFFAYNDKNLRQGKRDFQRKWGDRTLEDNWRRSNKQSSGLDTQTGFDSTNQVTASISADEMSTILKGIPTTPDAKKIANIKIREAMFNLGVLYRERLQNHPRSVTALEELNTRYPEHDRELDSWYYLYLGYKDLQNAAKAQEYADKIVSKYPGTNYAKVIQDPTYVIEMQNEERKLEAYYNDAYTAFTAGSYQEAYDKSVQAPEKFGASNAYQPKFALLIAMTTGNLKGKDEYIGALNEVIAKYQNTEEQKYAREVLRLLGASTGTLPGEQKVEAAEFDPKIDQVHSIIIALNDGATLNDAKNFVSDYNRKYHDLEKLRISDVYLVNGEARTPLIVVRRFKDKADAMRFYEGVQKNKQDFIPEKFRYEMYPISQANYGKLFSSVKSIEAYKSFFEDNY